jgi:hypothetical protein
VFAFCAPALPVGFNDDAEQITNADDRTSRASVTTHAKRSRVEVFMVNPSVEV